jgi:hypothetical protein
MPPYSFSQLVEMRKNEVQRLLKYIVAQRADYQNKINSLDVQQKRLEEESSEEWVRINQKGHY